VSRTRSQTNTGVSGRSTSPPDRPLLERLVSAERFIFDVDGCLALGATPGGQGGRAVPGAPELLRELKRRGARIVCATNGSGRPPEAYAAGLREHGLPIDDTEMLTPPVVAAEHLARDRAGATVMALGPDGVVTPLERAGIVLVAAERGARADVVLAGPVARIDADAFQAAAQAVWAGAELIVTSYVPAIPVRGGRVASMSAAIGAALAHVTGVVPTVVGKPSPLVGEVAAARMGCRVDELVVVGDDPALEVALGRAVGAATVLVLSGIASEGDVARLPELHRPDVVVRDVGDLLAALRAVAG
jgi:4-nitrophenyl phosphatase